jgi:glutamine amidotransferase
MVIAILNYGVGNIAALTNMLDYIGVDSVVVADPASLLLAEKVILPGVGAFDQAIRCLDSLTLRDPLLEFATVHRRPVLGVCLGMQLLGLASEEGAERGLGLIKATTRRIRPNDPSVKVPHMGWAEVTPTRSSALFPDTEEKMRFYFAHSYHVDCESEHTVLAHISHGGAMASAIQSDNILGVQFHPEKSHRFGAAILKRFAEM